MIRELSVRLPVGLYLLGREGVEERAYHRPGHAVSAVDDHAHPPDRLRIDVPEGRFAEGINDVFKADVARRVGRRTRLAADDDLPQLADPRVARERYSAALHELRSGIGLGVVGRRAGQAAVQLS